MDELLYEQSVIDLYKSLLGREASIDEVKLFKDNNKTIGEVIEVIGNSEERKATLINYLGRRITKKDDIDKYYVELLGRHISENELISWFANGCYENDLISKIIINQYLHMVYADV